MGIQSRRKDRSVRRIALQELSETSMIEGGGRKPTEQRTDGGTRCRQRPRRADVNHMKMGRCLVLWLLQQAQLNQDRLRRLATNWSQGQAVRARRVSPPPFSKWHEVRYKLVKLTGELFKWAEDRLRAVPACPSERVCESQRATIEREREK